ncbi:hypothetical protein SSS_10334 [Sarcoptes scabiei]|nr:hypothetical protein SSS_10334 [Sarcoptes scabiei]
MNFKSFHDIIIANRNEMIAVLCIVTFAFLFKFTINALRKGLGGPKKFKLIDPSVYDGHRIQIRLNQLTVTHLSFNLLVEKYLSLCDSLNDIIEVFFYSLENLIDQWQINELMQAYISTLPNIFFFPENSQSNIYDLEMLSRVHQTIFDHFLGQQKINLNSLFLIFPSFSWIIKRPLMYSYLSTKLSQSTIPADVDKLYCLIDQIPFDNFNFFSRAELLICLSQNALKIIKEHHMINIDKYSALLEYFARTIDNMLRDNFSLVTLLHSFLIDGNLENINKYRKKIMLFLKNFVAETHSIYPRMSIISHIPNYVFFHDFRSLKFIINEFKLNRNREAFYELAKKILDNTPELKEYLRESISSEDYIDFLLFKRLEKIQRVYMKKLEQSYRYSLKHFSFDMKYYLNKNLSIIFVADINQIDVMMNELSKHSLIAFDTESLPIFPYLKNEISILQISVERICWIVDLHQKSPLYYSRVKNLLQTLDESYVRILGFDFGNDILGLKNTLNFQGSISFLDYMDLYKYSDKIVPFLASLNEKNIPNYLDI